MKYFGLIVLLVCISCVTAKPVVSGDIKLNIPDAWNMQSSVIYNDLNDKVGEVISKKYNNYKHGKDFLTAYQNGFEGEASELIYKSSGIDGELYWVCVKAPYEGDTSGRRDYAGQWYARIFWVKGTGIIFYSYQSCDENFKQIETIAKTVSE